MDEVIAELEKWQIQKDSDTRFLLTEARRILLEPHPGLYDVRRAQAMVLAVIATKMVEAK